MSKFSKEMIEVAKNEKNISESHLASEIKTFLSEEFVCNIAQYVNMLVLKFFNGQAFTVEITDCAEDMQKWESLIKEIDD